jgi:hypothetical protein
VGSRGASLKEAEAMGGARARGVFLNPN